MTTLTWVLSVILAVVGILLIVVILMQKDRAAGLGAMTASSGDTYWRKNKVNSVEGTLEKYTKILGAVFMILALVINFIH